MKKKVVDFWEGLPWYVRNVYFAVLVFFLFWMMFFDKYNLYSHYKFSKQLRQLEKQKEYFIREIKEIEELKLDLFSSDDHKERFARERYKMKKDNEDIFIIVEK
jgi:cell division protein DivIC